MKYDIIIGIETHIQLNTDTKMFCGCSTNHWKAQPNTNVCPVCLGLPGALPVINKKALDKAMLVGLALGATVPERCKFDRKNYFYPDLAKGYQISQYDQPLNIGGSLDVDGERIGIIRAHLEEDTGKSSHSAEGSLIDFNMAGIPLLEIVSEPMIHSAQQAKTYVQQLRQLARYIGVNEGSMERGMLRADINISLQEPGKWKYAHGEFVTHDGYRMNNRVEIKNLNSFRSIERAVDYEVARQSELLETGNTIDQETRGWDEARGATTAQRSKEEAHDYRYFPEPDLPPISVTKEWIDTIKGQLPELPQPKIQRFMTDYGLSDYDARLLAEERQSAEWFEQAVKAYSGQHVDDGSISIKVKKIANWMLGEIARLQNEHQNYVYESRLKPEQLAALLGLLDDEKISGANAKEVIAETYVSGADPLTIIADKGLEQVSGGDELEPIASKVIEANPDAVEKIKAGKTSTIQFLVGQVMRETRGRANPAIVQELIEKLIQ